MAAPVMNVDLSELMGSINIEQEEVVRKITEKKIIAELRFTDQQKEDLLQAFNLLDYTGVGKIDCDDFRVAIKALGYQPTKEDLLNMVRTVDKGRTGRLSFENFQTALMRKMMAKDDDVDIRKSFMMFDMDDTGLISFDNLKAVTEKLGIYLTDEEIDEMMDEADRDFDGFVDFDEFMRVMKCSVPIVTL